MSGHLPSVTNPRISLHQEFTMRTGGYDEIAKVKGPDGWTTFAAMVAKHGVVDAIERVVRCHWLSETDWRYDDDRPCVACLEVVHA